MNKLEVLSPQTAAESTGVVVDTSKIKSSKLFVSADALATTEEVDIEIYVGNEVYKAWINNSAAAYKLTASQYTLEIPNPGTLLKFKKDATAAACGIVLNWPDENLRGG